jgi:repressor LexA
MTRAIGRQRTAEELEWYETTEIPLLGVVAAGQPYQAFRVDETLTVPLHLWAGKQVFALRVRGTSMIDEGIHDGDFLIVTPRSTAENGQTVVAEIDGAVTVKVFHREADGQIRLQPANRELLPLRVPAESVRLVGVVVGVLRKLGFRRPNLHPAAVANRPPMAGTPPSTAAPAPVRTGRDTASMDLALNAIHAETERWHEAVRRAQRERRLQRHVPRMAELGRDLDALREWCARTDKPGLRRALLEEANRVVRRMHRLAGMLGVELPGAT